MSQDPRLFKATDVLLQGMDQHIDPLEKQDALYDLATTLYEISGNNQRTSHSYDYVAAERAREFIHASLYENISLDDIEKKCGTRPLESFTRFSTTVWYKSTSIYDHA